MRSRAMMLLLSIATVLAAATATPPPHQDHATAGGAAADAVVGVVYGPVISGLAFDFPMSLGGELSNCYGNHGSQRAWADMHAVDSSCRSKRPWAGEARPSIGAESSYSGFGGGSTLDLKSGTLFSIQFLGSSSTCQAMPPPPTVNELAAAGARSHGNCSSYVAALDAAAEVTLLYSTKLPRVTTSMDGCSSGIVAERPQLADAVRYLNRFRTALAERADAFSAAAQAARISNPDLKLPPPPGAVKGRVLPKLPELARKLRPPYAPC